MPDDFEGRRRVQDVDGKTRTSVWFAADGLDQILAVEGMRRARNGQPGVYAPNGNLQAGRTTFAWVNGHSYACRFFLEEDLLAAYVGFTLFVAGSANDECSVAVCSSEANLPRLGTSGAVLGKLNSGTPNQLVALGAATQLYAGTAYYATMSAAVTGTAPQVVGLDLKGASSVDAMGVGVPWREAGIRITNHPIPDPFGALAIPNVAPANVVPLLTVRSS